MVKDPFNTVESIEARLREGPLNGFEFQRIRTNLNRMAGPLRQKYKWGTLTERGRVDLRRLDDLLSRAKVLYKPIKGPRGGRSAAELEMAEDERKKKKGPVRVRPYRRRR